ncbi:MAG: 50S ribosomal protein L11 methyltransferase [Legionellaceae bacterium]|nr:50S ribosomal protein L11 methyltransferase [Legionellaceae bacterium]
MLELEIENCSQDNAELISDLLENLGAVSVTMVDKFDDPILEPELGTMPLWPHVVINALYGSDSELEQVKQALKTDYPELIYKIQELADKNWLEACLVDFKAQKFGDNLFVSPSWIKPTNDEGINLTLDPGLAFGTGSHSTTSLCLTWLQKVDLSHSRLIDYGCGSGILGLAALKLGAEHVFAVDIDEQALIATRNNANVNNIPDNQLSISDPDGLSDKADILLANILLKTLIKLKLDFVNLLKDNGTLVASGILANQTDELIEEYKSEFSMVAIEFDDEWAMVVFKKN